MFTNSTSGYRLQVLMLVLSAGVVAAADQRPPCSLDLPTYDAVGNRLAFKIISVSPREEGVNLLTSKPRGFSLVVDENRLYFSENLIAKGPFKITLGDQTGRRLTRSVVLTGCQGRISFQYGERATALDVGWVTVNGRIVGCALHGDWWIRALPMFGGHDGPTFEGYIDAKTGRFSLNCIRGERHIVIIGKDTQPLRVLGTNVIMGGKNDIGTTDLSGLCPK